MVAISVTDNDDTKFQAPDGVGGEDGHVDDEGVSISNEKY